MTKQGITWASFGSCYGYGAATFAMYLSLFFIYSCMFKCHGNPSMDFNEAEMDHVEH